MKNPKTDSGKSILGFYLFFELTYSELLQQF